MFLENILKTVLCILLPTVQNKSFVFLKKKLKNQHVLKIFFKPKQVSEKLFVDVMISEMIQPQRLFSLVLF